MEKSIDRFRDNNRIPPTEPGMIIYIDNGIHAHVVRDEVISMSRTYTEKELAEMGENAQKFLEEDYMRAFVESSPLRGVSNYKRFGRLTEADGVSQVISFTYYLVPNYVTECTCEEGESQRPE
jgi:hypothetical protein